MVFVLDNPIFYSYYVSKVLAFCYFFVSPPLSLPRIFKTFT
jgi:hypothetical protein